MTTDDSDRQAAAHNRLEELREKQRTSDRKRITIRTEDQQDAALRALAEGKNGADLRVLEMLTGLVMTGQTINPDFQRIANAIVAQSVLLGKLPPKPRGRPKDQENDDSRAVAMQYFDLVDAGVSYADAVAQVAARFHKDERHIMRLVKRGKLWAGLTKEERDARREFYRFLLHDGLDSALRGLRDIGEPFSKATEAMMQRDYIGEVDDLIDEELERKVFADKKSFGFIASD